MTYHLARDGQQLGTFSESEIISKYSSGQLLGTDLCWKEGMADWQPVSVAFSFNGASAPVINPYAAPRADVSRQVTSSQSIELASRWTRLAAQFLDGLVAIPIAIPFGIGMATMDQETQAFTSIGLICVSISGILFLGLLIYTLYLLSTQGQTLGKKWLGIRIVRYEDNGPAGFVKAVLLRIIVNGIIGVIPLLGALYSLIDILFIFSDDKRCLHDKMAGTHVVKA